MKEYFDIVFITTFINTNYIGKLIDSIVLNNRVLNVLLLVVNQTEQNLNLSQYSNNNNCIVELKSGKTSLSAARNVGLKFLFNNNFATHYVAFPDDDSSFDSNFFENFNFVIINNKNYLIDVYGEGTDDLYLKNSIKDGAFISTNTSQIAMSVNMIINNDTIKAVKYLDEKMGIGAKYGAGEDSDYFLRCVSISGAFIYTKQLWNYHPKYETKHKKLIFSQLLKKYKNYGRGVIYLNYKHRLYGNAVKLCFSALAGSFVALLHLDFKLSLARLYAFFVRSFTFVGLLVSNKK
ncbi:hypothetical protein FACS189429_5920 [Bacteroidia bacterium]|nr:hypothetical protein FACS189429_5920 [Bacteroidia bacterium]